MSRKKGEKGGTEEMDKDRQCILRYIQDLLDMEAPRKILCGRIGERFMPPDRIVSIQLINDMIAMTLEADRAFADPVVFYYAIRVKKIDFTSDESVLACLGGAGVTGLDLMKMVSFLGLC